MVKKRNSVEKDILITVRNYIHELRKNNINICDAYLYGSYVKKSASADSDIDVAIISDSFSGDWFKDITLLLKLRRHIDVRIEPLPFTPADFNSSQPLYYHIKRSGLKIA
ncbi:MAG: nucleotidyltransferase domain-containing protein [Candidatus Hydrogenedentota bacterium]